MRLVDIDKVKKNLDENKPDWTAEDYAVACEDAEFYSSIEDFIAEHDDEIEMMMFAPELVPDEPKWIPCAERMPEDKVPVLFVWRSQNGNVSVLHGWHFEIRSLGSAWHQSGMGMHRPDNEVTHWMPLPEPPKDGDVP